MSDELKELFEYSFLGIKLIFVFKGLSFLACLCKLLLLLIFGVPYIVVELLKILFTLLGYIPIIGFLFELIAGFVFTLLANLFFYLIMLPDTHNDRNN